MQKLIILGILISFNTIASNKSICGFRDNRDLSNDPKIARSTNLFDEGYCTITMIGKSCALTAGHCVRADAVDKIEFDVPLSSPEGVASQSTKENTYYRSRRYSRYEDNKAGKDWAVIMIKKNSQTGLYPGEARGFYEVSLSGKTRKGTEVSVTGYGADYDQLERMTVQQEHSGVIIKAGTFFRSSRVFHDADTMGGTSGAAIIDNQTNQIIGIHTNGGCEDRGYNQGTLTAKRKKLRKAIQACLEIEKTL